MSAQITDEEIDLLSDEEIVGALPPTFRELTDGMEIATILTLVNFAGGTRMRFPIDPKGTRLEKAVGSGVARTLCRCFGGDYLDIPKCTGIKGLARKKIVLNLRKHGLSTREIARELDLGQRRVWQILAGARNGAN